MTREEIAAEYLTIPNALLQALGGACYLRKTVGAIQFEILHSWPSFADMPPFGLSFCFRVEDQSYRARLCTSVSERDRYGLDIHSVSPNHRHLSESELTLEGAIPLEGFAIAQFFAFAQTALPV
jgi:hypothetical protein